MRFMEPIKMSEDLLTDLQPPRIENGRTLLIAGMGQRYNSETSAGIPEQWQRFGPHIGNIPTQIGRDTYGVLCNGDEQGTIEYISGVEVSEFRGIPKDWRCLTIPKQKYLVFSCHDHISSIRRVWTTIWNKWLPESPYRVVKGPEFEHYPPNFDPVTGTGGYEIWLPVEE
jgi:AraC family transcriptional regulator